MQDPKSIIEQARSGHVPQTWRVIRPRGSYPVLAAVRAFFLTLAALFAAFVILLMLGIAGPAIFGSLTNTSSAPPWLEGLLDFLYSYGLVVIPVGVAAIFVAAVGIAGARAAGNMPYSFIILTPDGLVQSLAPNAITVLDFAAIDEITRLLWVSTTTYQGGGSSSSTAMFATLHYRDGRTKRWRPNWRFITRFGSDQDFVERLINAHERYRAQIGAVGGASHDRYSPPTPDVPLQAPPPYTPVLPSTSKSQARSLRRGIIIAVVIVLLACGGAVFGLVKLSQASFHPSVITTFCNAIKSGDIAMAYSNLSSSFQTRATKETFLSPPDGSGGQFVGCNGSKYIPDCPATGTCTFTTYIVDFTIRGGANDGKTLPYLIDTVRENVDPVRKTGDDKIDRISAYQP